MALKIAHIIQDTRDFYWPIGIMSIQEKVSWLFHARIARPPSAQLQMPRTCAFDQDI